MRPGDYILSRNENDPEGPVSTRQVEEVFVRQGYVLDLRVNGQLIRTTEEHPFYRAGDGWVAAWELRPGDQVVGQGGQLLEVESVTQTGIVETVYNVRISEWHTYFVGCDEWGFSVWAHNACWGDVAGMTQATGDFIANRVQQFNGTPSIGSCTSHSLDIETHLRANGFPGAVMRSPTGPGQHDMVVVIVNGQRFIIDATASQFAGRITPASRVATWGQQLHQTGIWTDAEYNAFLQACNPNWHY